MADEILDLYEQDHNDELLKERVEMASDKVLFGEFGLKLIMVFLSY